MGKEITYTCDRCGDKIAQGAGIAKFSFRGGEKILCLGCGRDLDKFLDEKKSGFSKVASFIKKNMEL